jgi:tetratricopeptide (TPR) repeat protein
MACWQLRWWMSASGAELCMLVVAAAVVGAEWSAARRWTLVLTIGAVFVSQSVARIVNEDAAVSSRTAEAADAMQPLYRDIAATLRQSSSQPVVLLSSPNASAGIGYFGGFKTLGTLYWENVAGLSAAAAIFSAHTDDEARALLQARGVTHIALLSNSDFLRGYFAFADAGAPADAIAATFGYRLAAGASPRWLRLLPFRVRPGTPSSVLLFEVVPDQTEFDASWSAGSAWLTMGQSKRAERAFRDAIESAPSARRAELYQTAARAAYQADSHAVALSLYRSALELAPTPTLRVNMAWILATSADDRVRDDQAALALAAPLAHEFPRDPIILDSYAASLAGLGRFADALKIVEQMQAIEHAIGNAGGEARAQTRIDAYSAGRPWRQ